MGKPPKKQHNKLATLIRSSPWIVRYPVWRLSERLHRGTAVRYPQHVVLVVANHFEPSWNAEGAMLTWRTQESRLERWCVQARSIGADVRDCEGIPFRHTYFCPAEQYHPSLLERLAGLQGEGFGEVEVHLHHGVERPDNEANLKETIIRFRDTLAEKHRCLSQRAGSDVPMYAFVHGNWALANSAGGRCCGVDSEMQVLHETGCYADLTLPSAPDRSQVPRMNAIYQCGRPLRERSPHRSGPELRVGDAPTLPILLTGPLTFYYDLGTPGIRWPGLDTGALAAGHSLDLARFYRWKGARIGVKGRPDWIFIKLFCHGFFDFDQGHTIGEPLRHFLQDVLDTSDRTGQFKVYFATAREAFNMILAALDGQDGDPGMYRNYRLRLIMREAEHGGDPHLPARGCAR